MHKIVYRICVHNDVAINVLGFNWVVDVNIGGLVPIKIQHMSLCTKFGTQLCASSIFHVIYKHHRLLNKIYFFLRKSAERASATY